MNCVTPNCPNAALAHSNYCAVHQPSSPPSGTRPVLRRTHRSRRRAVQLVAVLVLLVVAWLVIQAVRHA